MQKKMFSAGIITAYTVQPAHIPSP